MLSHFYLALLGSLVRLVAFTAVISCLYFSCEFSDQFLQGGLFSNCCCFLTSGVQFVYQES